MERAIAAALADARALVDNGMDAIIVENYGDAPFTAGRVAASTVSAMTVIAHEIRRALPSTPLGVNVLKSDPRSALAVATAVGARFIRVNVLAGAVVADQGIVQTDAYDLLRDRRLLGVEVAIFADVQGKHAVPLAPVELEQQARDLASRSLADGLVVSGRATGDRRPQARAQRGAGRADPRRQRRHARDGGGSALARRRADRRHLAQARRRREQTRRSRARATAGRRRRWPLGFRAAFSSAPRSSSS